MTNIERNLSDFGLNENEIKLYLALLEGGPSTVLNLSKNTKINRTTAHINVESLIQKGMATPLKYGARRQIIAEPPEKLKLILEEEKIGLSRKEAILPDLITSLNSNISNIKKNTETEVRYYVGHEAVARIYDEILTSNEIRSYYNFRALTNFFPENKDKFYKAGIKGVKIWDIITSDNHEDYLSNLNMYKKTPSIKFKILPSNISINFMDYLIYNGKISIIYFDSEPKAIVIDNPLLYENAKVLFDLLWEFLN